jgi:hypothetical protein
VYNLPGLQAATTTLYVLTDGSTSHTYTIPLKSRDGTALNLGLSKSGDSQNIITASLSSATVSSTTPSEVKIIVNATSVANGVYPVTLTVSTPGLPAVTITVTVQKVTKVYSVFLPNIIR